MAERPQLVQFGELTVAHFQRHPVWIQCHGADDAEPWYDDTDEETFRPCDEPLPVGPDLGMLLVWATGTLADGTVLPAFLTPIFVDGHPGTSHPMGGMQPQLFGPSGAREAFWVGMMEPSRADLDAFYRRAGRQPEEIFPIRFAADAGLARGGVSGLVEGFYVLTKFSERPKILR
jgi:hypothetical protein